MTGQTVSTLTCDRDRGPRVGGMRLPCGATMRAAGSLDTARAAARREGWAHRGQHDYCPKCA